jgi:rhodanese-related sulfurtransferase
MNWSFVLAIGLVLVVIIALKRLGLVSAKAARMHLKQGALVVDVRSAAEFRASHLPEAVNIPLDELPDSLPRSISDKNQVLLLHCLSGMRSGMAKRMLKGMGYTNAFNLGSYNRARRIVNR